MHITIDGEKFEVTEVYDGCYGVDIELEDGREFVIFESAAEAGRLARKYWEDMANDDPGELVCLVGKETLVAWALGQYAGPGSTQVTSLENWLDLFLDAPEEEWGRWDGTECEAFIDGDLADEIDFSDDAVAYQTN